MGCPEAERQPIIESEEVGVTDGVSLIPSDIPQVPRGTCENDETGDHKKETVFTSLRIMATLSYRASLLPPCDMARTRLSTTTASP